MTNPSILTRRLPVTPASAAFILFGLFTTYDASARDNTSVDVLATIIENRTISVAADPVEFGEIGIPANAGQTCTYRVYQQGFGAPLSDILGATIDDANPDPENCAFGGIQSALEAVVTCEAGAEFSFSMDFTTSGGAQAAGVTLAGSDGFGDAPGLNVSGTETCNAPAAGITRLTPVTTLQVPSTASAFDGVVGTIEISLNY